MCINDLFKGLLLEIELVRTLKSTNKKDTIHHYLKIMNFDNDHLLHQSLIYHVKSYCLLKQRIQMLWNSPFLECDRSSLYSASSPATENTYWSMDSTGAETNNKWEYCENKQWWCCSFPPDREKWCYEETNNSAWSDTPAQDKWPYCEEKFCPCQTSFLSKTTTDDSSTICKLETTTAR